MKKYIATFLVSGLIAGSGVYFWTQNRQTTEKTEEIVACDTAADADFNQKACESERNALKTMVETLEARVTAFEQTEQDTNYSFATCIDGYSENVENKFKKTNEEFINQLLRTEFINQEIVNSFFENTDIQKIQKTGNIYQLCYTPQNAMSFVAFGEFGEYNNTIGIYDPQNNTLITDQKKNPGSGDIGLCAITGYLEKNIIYSCGGGDGPGGWNTVYLLDAISGDSTLIKDCRHTDDEPTTCTTNVLEITTPF